METADQPTAGSLRSQKPPDAEPATNPCVTSPDPQSAGSDGARPASLYLGNLALGGGAALAPPKPDKEAALLPDSSTVVRFSPAWKQTLAASGSILLTLCAGVTSGYSAVLLPQLRACAAPLGLRALDDDTASWIASMAALPMAPGCLAAGWLMERLGRRRAHFLVCGAFLAGWLLLAGARGLAAVLAGRALTGLCTGLLGPLGPVYLAESTAPRLRGTFLAAVSLAIAAGIMLAHALGAALTWRATAGVACALPALAALLLAAAPESPAWLAARGRPEDAARAFHWLRGHDAEAREELRALLARWRAADAQPAGDWRARLRALRSPALWKPLLIMCLFFLTCQFSGVNAVAFYSADIVQRALGGEGSERARHAGVLALDAVRVLASVAACALCRRCGRRPLALWSGALSAAALLALAGALHWEAPAWAPLAGLLGYVGAVSLGLVPLPWAMCGEVFGAGVRGLGAGAASAVAFGAFFAVVKTAPALLAGLGAGGTFVAYGAAAAGGTALLAAVLPETRGRSLQDIEDRFAGARVPRPEPGV